VTPELSTARPVRVSIPASVAANVDSLKKSVETVLGKLGCPQCCSGHDIFFEIQRDVMIRKGLRDDAEIAAPTRMASKIREIPAVRVGVNPGAVAKIDDVFAAIDRIADLTGHPACATGCDIFMQLERILVLDAKLKIEEQVMQIG
jgi:hypothetical protein